MALALSLVANAAEKTFTVKVTNPASREKKAVPVVITLNEEVASALVRQGDKEIPCQLDDLNDDGIYDELAFLTDMKKKERQTFTVTLSTEGEPKAYTNQTYGYLGIRDRNAKNQKHQQIKYLYTCRYQRGNYFQDHWKQSCQEQSC